MSRPYRGPVTVKDLILIPVVITFLVSLIRLVGELARGPEWLFGRAAGGGGALVGIAWLVPIFGVYFAVKQVRRGAGPSSLSRAFFWFPLSLLVMVGGAVLAPRLGLEATSVPALLFFAVLSLVAVAVASRGWSFLFKPLLAYAIGARIPVVVIMLVSMIGDWGTHYDAPPPGFPEMGVLSKWILIGVIPQLTIWIAFTVGVGGLFGGLVGGFMTLFGKGRRTAESVP